MYSPGFDNDSGWGMVDANAALAAVPTLTDLDGDESVGAACPADVTGDGVVDASDLANSIGAWD